MGKSPKARSFTIRFGRTRRGQATVADVFAAMLGRAMPAKCAACGGVTDPDATCPSHGRCQCSKPATDPEAL